MKKEFSCYLRMIVGAVLSTGSVWAFALLLHCNSSDLIMATCEGSAYILPLICTFIWPCLIGLGFVFSAGMDWFTLQEEKK